MDMVVSCARFPRPGETLLGGDFGMYPGGKGANQAVACARLGGTVDFLGKMGDDVFRERLTASLKADGVRIDALQVDPEAPTGIALITVSDEGENQIIVVSGSNMRLTPEEVEAAHALFAASSVVLAQLEVPLETVARAAQMAEDALFILNPAPARELPRTLLQHVDILTPNQTEAAVLAGMEVNDSASAEAAARHLRAQGVVTVIVTLGAQGALCVGEAGVRHYDAVPVQTVDSTGAGDAFNGALALALAEGRGLDEAIPFANTVAAFAVTRRGAQTSMPTREELEDFQQNHRERTPSVETATSE